MESILIVLKTGVIKEIQSTTDQVEIFVLDLDESESLVPYIYSINPKRMTVSLDSLEDLSELLKHTEEDKNDESD